MIQIHSSAVVAKDAQLGEGVVIGPNCVIDEGVAVGDGTVIGPNVVIDKDVKIGRNNRLLANCAIGGGPQILGFGSNTEGGGILIGDNNIFREQVTIHRSMHRGEFTKVGNDNLLMVGTHLGHDCILEDKIVMSNYVQLGGHCKIETGVWFSGMVLLHQFVTIGKWCYAAGLAGITHDVPPFLIVSGHYPMRVRGVNRRGMARAGLSPQQQEKIFDAYKKLYRRKGKGTLLESVEDLAKEGSLDENVQAMIDMIINSSKHRFGRYRESFRTTRRR